MIYFINRLRNNSGNSSRATQHEDNEKKGSPITTEDKIEGNHSGYGRQIRPEGIEKERCRRSRKLTGVELRQLETDQIKLVQILKDEGYKEVNNQKGIYYKCKIKLKEVKLLLHRLQASALQQTVSSDDISRSHSARVSGGIFIVSYIDINQKNDDDNALVLVVANTVHKELYRKYLKNDIWPSGKPPARKIPKTILSKEEQGKRKKLIELLNKRGLLNISTQMKLGELKDIIKQFGPCNFMIRACASRVSRSSVARILNIDFYFDYIDYDQITDDDDAIVLARIYVR
jgi:hypothetical protein